jgi:hypothetical protein
VDGGIMAFLIITLLVGFLLFAIVDKGARRRRPRSHRPVASSRGYRGFVDQSEIKARWETIMATSQTGASGLKSSINEADKLLDHVLKQLGYGGERMGDRLKAAGPRFTNQNHVWRAHKLRNALAHEIGFDLVPSQAREALKDFEQALKDVQALP